MAARMQSHRLSICTSCKCTELCLTWLPRNTAGADWLAIKLMAAYTLVCIQAQNALAIQLQHVCEMLLLNIVLAIVLMAAHIHVQAEHVLAKVLQQILMHMPAAHPSMGWLNQAEAIMC